MKVREQKLSREPQFIYTHIVFHSVILLLGMYLEVRSQMQTQIWYENVQKRVIYVACGRQRSISLKFLYNQHFFTKTCNKNRKYSLHRARFVSGIYDVFHLSSEIYCQNRETRSYPYITQECLFSLHSVSCFSQMISLSVLDGFQFT